MVFTHTKKNTELFKFQVLDLQMYWKKLYNFREIDIFPLQNIFIFYHQKLQ